MFGAKKKKKKKRSKEEGDEGESGAGADATGTSVHPADQPPLIESEEQWQLTDRDYTYHELLGRAFKLIRQNNPSLAGERGQFIMVPPQVQRDGSKKTAFLNIMDVCRRMNRPSDHLIAFLFTELATQGSVDSGNRLIIKGRFNQGQIENLLRKYILEYVQCKTCKSYESSMRKENRLTFVQCTACGSSRTVQAIKSGFLAQTGRRSKTKQ